MSTAGLGPVPVPDVCPYCGSTAISGSRCQQCRGLTDPLSLQASQNDMGPWFVRAENAPFRPGCSYRVLVQQVLKGRITANSILRGPPTRQFWMAAARTPGISHLLGVCHSCAATVATDSECCTICRASFVIEPSRQHLGLGPMYLVPGQNSGEDVVVAGKKLPPLVADSVDFEPLHLEDAAEARPLPREPAVRAGGSTAHQEPRRGNRWAIVVLIWAIIVTIASGMLAADKLREMSRGKSQAQAPK